jgi:hypothetical protein
MTRVPVSYVAIDRRTETVTAAQVSEAGSRMLFGREVDIEEWIHRFLHGSACVERWRLEVDETDRSAEPDGAASTSIALKPPGLPLVLERGGKTRPVDERSEVKTGDVLCLALPVNDEAARTRLREEGWVPVETNGRYSCRR